MTVALYARVSTQEQDPENQLQRLNQVAKVRGYDDVEYFIDYASGADPNRPELDRMLRMAQHGKIEKIIAVKLDRLARSTINLLHIMQQLDSWRVSVEFLDQPIDTSTPMGKMMLTVLGAMAEFERELIRDRTRDGLKRAAAQGRTGGRPKRELSDYQLKKAREILERNPQISHQELADNFQGISRATLIKLLREKGVLS